MFRMITPLARPSSKRSSTTRIILIGFGCIQDARGWAQPFFEWYNHQHYHTGLNLLTPASVHYGQAEVIRQQRQLVLAAAYAQHPQRFVRGEPIVKGAPDAVWINPPIVPNLP